MVDKGQVEYGNFFTAMFAVMFGGFGVGQVNLRSLCGAFLYNQYQVSSTIVSTRCFDPLAVI